MPFKPSKKWTARALTMLSLTLLVGCETQISDACAWLKPIAPNPGFDKRWTPDEMRQVDSLDKSIDKNCGR